jgi:mevalonate kinase
MEPYVIHLSTEKQLSILLPNANRALAEVLKNATPQQLETMVQDRDIKAVITQLLDKAVADSKTNSLVNELLKNAPVFKQLGTVAGEIKTLQQALSALPAEQQKPLARLMDALQGFLKDMRAMEPGVLKQQVSDSGVFMESKLSAQSAPRTELKMLLEQLQAQLRQSDLPALKPVIRQISQLLLDDQLFTTASKVPDKRLAAEVQKLLQPLQQQLNLSDPVRQAAVTKTIEQLMPYAKVIPPPSLEHAPLKQLDTLLQQLKEPLQQSRLPQAQSILNAVGEIRSAIANLPVQVNPVVEKALMPLLQQSAQIVATLSQVPRPPADAKLLTQLQQVLTQAVEQFQTGKQPTFESIGKALEQSRPLLQMPSTERFEKVTAMLSQLKTEITAPKPDLPKLFEPFTQLQQELNTLVKSAPLLLTKPMAEEMQSLQSVMQQMAARPQSVSASLLDRIVTALLGQVQQFDTASLKTLMTNTQTLVDAKPPGFMQQMNAAGINDDIRSLLSQLSTIRHQGDALFSKEVNGLLDRLAGFVKPENLSVEQVVRESLSKDLKAILLKLGDEVQRAAPPNSAEIMKHVDKLLLQIDYHQLLSHVSNSSALFMPYEWGMLDQGSLAFKHAGNDHFYCEIDLQLKEYGQLNLMLELFDTNQLNMRIYTEKEELKTVMMERLKELRLALNSVDIMPRQIRFFDQKEEKNRYLGDNGDIDLGFEVKV